MRTVRLPIAVGVATILLVLLASARANVDDRGTAVATNAVLGLGALLATLVVTTRGTLRRAVVTVSGIAVASGLAAAGAGASASLRDLLDAAAVAVVVAVARHWFSDATAPRLRGLLGLTAAAAMVGGVSAAAIEWASSIDAAGAAGSQWRYATAVAMFAGDLVVMATYVAGRIESAAREYWWRAAATTVAALAAAAVVLIVTVAQTGNTRTAIWLATCGGVAATLLMTAARWHDSSRLRGLAAVVAVAFVDAAAITELAALSDAASVPGAIAIIAGTLAAMARLGAVARRDTRIEQPLFLLAAIFAVVAFDGASLVVATLLPDAGVSAVHKLLWFADLGIALMVATRWMPPRAAYLCRRLVLGAVTVLLVSMVVFFLLDQLPDKWWSHLVNARGNSLERRAFLRHQFGVDQPGLVRYLVWLDQLLQWPPYLGYSDYLHQNVAGLIAPHVVPTLILMGSSYILQLLVAVPIGIIAAARQYSRLDNAVTTASFVGISMPNYWFGSMLIFFLAILPVENGHGVIFPVGGACGINGTDGGPNCWHNAPLLDQAWHLVLPAIVLAVQGIAGYARFVRGSMLDVLNQDFVRTARAKGLSPLRVLVRHAFRNSLLPLITLMGIDIPQLFVGAIITEFVFNWPGMGQLSVISINSDDVPVVLGILLILSVLVVVGSLIADLLYTLADPRIKYSD